MVEVIVNFFPPNIHTLRNEYFMYGFFFFFIVHCSLHFFFHVRFWDPLLYPCFSSFSIEKR